MRTLLSGLLLLAWAGPAAAGCPPAWPNATFLQLYADDPPDTPDRLRRWRALGSEELILQWSAWGPADGGPFPLLQSGRIAALLAAAEAAGLRLRLGLRYDPGFWEDHEEEEEEGLPEHRPGLERYLEQRLSDQRALIAALAPLAAHPAFAGWYIADEIDDRRWNAPRRRQRLADYLGRLAGLLRAATPGASIAISGFSDGRLPPQEWAELWAGLLPAAGIDRLLFQDGIGAGKLELAELGLYLPLLAAALAVADRELALVVELFEPDPEGGFRPAPLERTLAQLAQAAFTGRPPVVFALPHYADPAAGPQAATLAEALAALHARCSG